MNNEPERDRIMDTMAKNSRETVAVMPRRFKGHCFCDVHVMAAKPDGGTTPTGKGVALKAGAIPELIGLLQRVHAAAVAAGWCGEDGD